jgi:hypothetical protein
MTDPDLARRFQEAAESCWPGRTVVATITTVACHGREALCWEVELSDSCERVARHAVAEGLDPDPVRIARGLRDALAMSAHLTTHERIGY